MRRQLEEMGLMSMNGSVRTSVLEAPLSRNVSMEYTGNEYDDLDYIAGSDNGRNVMPL